MYIQIADDYNDLKECKAKLEKLIEAGDIEGAKTLFSSLDINPLENPSFVSIYSIILINEGKLTEAKSWLAKGSESFPYNFDINYNLAMLEKEIGEVSNYMTTLLRAYKFSESDEDKVLIQEELDNISNYLIKNVPKSLKDFSKYVSKFKPKESSYDGRVYPLGLDGGSAVGSFIKDENTRQGAYLCLYKTEHYFNLNSEFRWLFKTELVHGRIVESEARIILERPSIISYSVNTYNTITVEINGNTMKYKDPFINTVHYLPIREIGELVIRGDKEFFLGEVFDLEDKITEDKPPLVLTMFLDGLSYETLVEDGIENLMPNTFRYFQSGVNFSHVYAASEWTLPSIASVFTGLTTSRHNLYNAEIHSTLPSGSKILSEYLKNMGYYTTQICNNWRKTPHYGYDRGFDRTIFQPGIEGLGCDEMIMEAIEHLEAFESKNNFLWMSFIDLHKVTDCIEPFIMNQLRSKPENRCFNFDERPSVFKDYDEHKIELYKLDIKRLDFYLGILFDYLDKKYGENIAVTVFSDHGQTFLSSEETFFHEKRTRVPLFVKSPYIAKGECDEILSLVDIFPIVLKSAGYKGEIKGNIDGILPISLGGNEGRSFAFTEAIFPGQTYKAVISDKFHRFTFETEHFVRVDGRVELGDYKVALLDSTTKEDVSSTNKSKVDRYLDVVWKHIKRFVVI